jgi:hypothetical protein
MYTQSLQHMYQAWQQDNPTYIEDWYKFVQLAAKWLDASTNDVIIILNQCAWFKQGWPPLSRLY